MAKHSEADFIVPVIRAIYDNGGKCDMATIKDQVGNYITLTPEDLEPMPSRRKTEPCYRQIVGNLVSHNPKKFSQYVEKEYGTDENGEQSRLYEFRLNEEGEKYAKQFIPQNHSVVIETPDLDDLLDLVEPESDPIADLSKLVDSFDSKVISAAENKNFKRASLTNAGLGQTVNRINNYTCQYGKLIGEKHESFTDNNGNNYVEPHHLIPMKASRDFFPRGLDRPSNIVTLCPNCHYLLHHGSEEEVKRVLKVLYTNYIGALNSDDIYITFEDLYNKYYRRKG